MGTAAPILCIEMERLVQSYIRAVAEWSRLHTAQVQALKGGGNYKFTGALVEAAERVETTKHAIVAHRQTHCC